MPYVKNDNFYEYLINPLVCFLVFFILKNTKNIKKTLNLNYNNSFQPTMPRYDRVLKISKSSSANLLHYNQNIY